ncbi:hypothetical protein [Parablautia muri]|uniref:Uncharacterized protein n=1 Tax=Parablautia muri TaxID=2320879 RepID=A0A9X5GU12_9FIRM|nr:hypothetical protein [Parablautia muri]NBJ93567.1 hypothetical protein [Parablautia muri]
MGEKNTGELEKVLQSTHIKNFNTYCRENVGCLTEGDFTVYMKNIISEKKLTQQLVFLRADVPERYGYKLLSGEKRTRQRDVILRICYAAEMSLAQTQRALKKYEMPELYAKRPRDALLMIIFNERPGDIIDVNEILKEHGMETLRTSGIYLG